MVRTVIQNGRVLDKIQPIETPAARGRKHPTYEEVVAHARGALLNLFAPQLAVDYAQARAIGAFANSIENLFDDVVEAEFESGFAQLLERLGSTPPALNRFLTGNWWVLDSRWRPYDRSAIPREVARVSHLPDTRGQRWLRDLGIAVPGEFDTVEHVLRQLHWAFAHPAAFSPDNRCFLLLKACELYEQLPESEQQRFFAAGWPVASWKARDELGKQHLQLALRVQDSWAAARQGRAPKPI